MTSTIKYIYDESDGQKCCLNRKGLREGKLKEQYNKISLSFSYIAAFLLALFPAKLPRKDLSEKQKREQAEVTYYGHLRDLPKALLELAGNATYMFISLAATMDGFLLAGMAAFLPKYFESQFMLSPGNAAMLVGILVVPAGAGGTLLGGYLGKRLRLDRAGYIKMYIVCQAVILPLYLGFLLYCPNADFAGVISDGAAVAGGGSQLGCGLDCACSRADYDPVCSAAGNVTFFNACFAGCSDVVLDVNNGGALATFANCSCAASEAADAATSSSFVSKGVCDGAMCDYTPLAAIVFLQVFFTFATALPGLVASLR